MKRGKIIACLRTDLLQFRNPVWQTQNLFRNKCVKNINFGNFNFCLCRYVAAKTSFFRSQIRLPDLENRMGVLLTWCNNFIDNRSGPGQPFEGFTPQDTAGNWGRARNRWYGYSFGGASPKGDPQYNPTLEWQCVAEQKWMRESQLRSLLYLQVSQFQRVESTLWTLSGVLFLTLSDVSILVNLHFKLTIHSLYADH